METICTAEIKANCQNATEAARSLLSLTQTILDSRVDADNFAKVITNLASSLSSLDKEALINVSNNAVAAISNMVENSRSSLVTNGARGNNTNAIKSMIDSLQTSFGAKVESGEVIKVVTNVIKAAVSRLNGALLATVTETSIIVRDEEGNRKRRETTPGVIVKVQPNGFSDGRVASIVAYKDDTLFKTPDQLQIAAGQDVQLIFTLLSQIVSIKITNAKDVSIVITFSLNKTVNTNGTTLCRYWNSDEGTWMTNGVKTLSSKGSTVNCEASFLSDFGVVHEAEPTQAPTLATTTASTTTTTTTTTRHVRKTTSTPFIITTQEVSLGKTISLVSNVLLIVLLFVSMAIVLQN